MHVHTNTVCYELRRYDDDCRLAERSISMYKSCSCYSHVVKETQQKGRRLRGIVLEIRDKKWGGVGNSQWTTSALSWELMSFQASAGGCRGIALSQSKRDSITEPRNRVWGGFEAKLFLPAPFVHIWNARAWLWRRKRKGGGKWALGDKAYCGLCH